MLSENQIDRILGGLGELSERGLLDREQADDIADRLHRVGPPDASPPSEPSRARDIHPLGPPA
ncbi:MAG: hypothetical protein GEV09_00570 [Pseudonocardiaceae bacterium]|nr:hypothetical protein [Pseudonocardiaceae bacterium]